MFLTILNALVAIPKIAGYIEAFVSQLMTWWVQRQTNQTLADIADAAAIGARAKTDEDRMAAAQAWQKALSRSRISR